MFQLAVLGGGPAGYTAAERAAQAGLNVVLFEKNALGGTCLNVGCIPTKTLLYSSKLYYNAVNGSKYGIKAEGVQFEYDKIVARKNKVVRKLIAGIKAKMTNNNVTVINGAATVVENANGVVTIACGDEQYQAEKLLICTGSQVAIPPIPGVDTAEYWTSTEALETKEVPESLVVIGGGVIGIEFAGLFATFGTKVTVIEMAPEILPGIDTEISAMLRAELAKKGVEFHLSSKVLHVATGCVTYSDSEGEHKAEATNVLLCVGRKPNLAGTEALGLEPYRNGNPASELISTACVAIEAGMTIEQLKKVVFPHPTVAEIFKETISE